MRIDTLSLDAGGVLVFPNWARISTALAAHGVDVDPAVLAAADPRAKRKIDDGALVAVSTDHSRSWPYFNLLLAEAGLTQNAETDAALSELHEYHAVNNLWELVPGDVRPALARFREMGLRLIVLSNSNGTLPKCFDRVGLTSCFDAVFDSQIEGVEKPDPRFFEIGLQRSGARPETTLHVGDIFHIDVAGARNAGLQAALLDPHDLYVGADCLRVPTLAALGTALEGATVFNS